MKRTYEIFGYTFIIALIAFSVLAHAQDENKVRDGKTIFTDSKCVSCHSIESQSLTPAKKPSGKMIPPDLSDVGNKLKSDFIIKYLHKEETIEGRKHLVMFKGEDSDLKILADWLESLKKEPAKQD